MNCRKVLRHIHVTLLAFKSIGLVFIFAIILAIIPIVYPTKVARGAYVLLLMTALWMTEVIPIYVTALLPIFLGPLLGLVTSAQVSEAYMKDTNMLFLGGLMVACALEYRNLHKRLAVSIFKVVGRSPKFIMLGFMVPSWFLSMWMSNTATTAMMITIVEAVLVSLNETTAEESVNDEESVEQIVESRVNSSTEIDLEMDKIENDDFDRRTISDCDSPRPVLPSAERAKKIHKLNIAFSLCICYASTCGGIATVTGTAPNSILYGFVLNHYGPDTGLNFGTWMLYALPISILMLLLVWVWLCIMYIGPKETFSCRKSTPSDDVIHDVIESSKNEIGHFSYAEGQCCVLFSLLTILWVTRNMGSFGWGRFFTATGSSKSLITDSAPAILVAVLCMILPAWNPVKTWKAWNEHYGQPGSAIPPEDQYLLPWPVVKNGLSWGVILVVGGGFALADICKSSGLSDEIGQFLSKYLIYIPISLLTLVLSVAICILTEFTSNTATASIVLPILMSVSQKMKLHPFQLAIPTVLSTSFAFCLPASTPPNAIVFARGRIRVKDMLRAGAVINVIACLVTLFATLTYGRLLFKLDTYPDWAMAAEGNSTQT